MRLSFSRSLLAGSLLVLAACQSSHIENPTTFSPCEATSQPVRTVTAATGTVYRDEASQRYRIHSPQAGTIDVVDIGVVCGTLPQSLQKDGTKVTFSGTYKTYGTPPSAPAGTTFYNLELTKIAAQ